MELTQGRHIETARKDLADAMVVPPNAWAKDLSFLLVTLSGFVLIVVLLLARG